METTSVKLYTLSYSQWKTYGLAAAFVAGNIILPQLCHLMPHGGLIWLPIYFFTLIGAYKYGWKVGLLTALLSPILNCALFGMPALAVLPAVLTKSILLAGAAGAANAYFKRISLPIMFGVILSYQVIGTLLEWAYVGNFYAAVQDFRLGIPGMLLQLVGGYLIVRYLMKK